MTPGKESEAETEALCAFIQQFTGTEYSKVPQSYKTVASQRITVVSYEHSFHVIKSMTWYIFCAALSIQIKSTCIKTEFKTTLEVLYVNCVIIFLQIVDTLLPLANLEARVKSAVDLITSAHKNISADSLRFAATTFYYKLKAADGYAPATKYHGNVMLIRAKTNSQYEQNLGADYKLSEVGLMNIAIENT